MNGFANLNGYPGTSEDLGALNFIKERSFVRLVDGFANLLTDIEDYSTTWQAKDKRELLNSIDKVLANPDFKRNFTVVLLKNIRIAYHSWR